MGCEIYHLGCKRVSEVRNVAVSYSAMLSTGELLTGTPTITSTSTGLTLASKAVSTGIETIKGETTPTGEAVKWSISSGVAGEVSIMTVSVATDDSVAQTLIRKYSIEVIAD